MTADKKNRKYEIVLPPSVSGGSPTALDPDRGSVVIVGANGAGKSRFASRMASDMDGRAFRMSALSALFERTTSPGRSEIDRLYIDHGGSVAEQSTELERLMWLLMRDEMLNLLNYKLQHAGDRTFKLEHTRLDEVIEAWQEIFPDNRVLIESGQLLFARRPESKAQTDDDLYSAVKLSNGEKAVIYYLGAISYAPKRSVVFVDSPEIFLHPTIMQSVWNRIELMRPDCTFVYTTHDLEFASSRRRSMVVWVRSYDARRVCWDYSILPPDTPMTEEIYSAILGARKPVLFIEGDARNSIDAKLYSLIFKDFTIRPLGSCNKVIEATRSFNDLNAFHQLDSYGIVDRDRRDENEVDYLRRKKVMVPEVAEVENILMLEDVIRAVAADCGMNEDRVFGRVKKTLIKQFGIDLCQQALLHTRHRVKKTVEYRIDGRFRNVEMLERHMHDLIDEVNPRRLYDDFCEQFQRYCKDGDYQSILKVYNQKSMLSGCNVAGLCGLSNKEQYVDRILRILRSNGATARRIAKAVRRCFNIESVASGAQWQNKEQRRNGKE